MKTCLDVSFQSISKSMCTKTIYKKFSSTYKFLIIDLIIGHGLYSEWSMDHCFKVHHL